VTTGEALDRVNELALHRVLERIAGFLNHCAPLYLDHRLLDVGVDTSEHAGEQVIAEQQRFCRDRLAMVVALMKRDHRFGHGGEQRITGEGNSGGRRAAFSLVLQIRCAREAEGREPNELPVHHSAGPDHDRGTLASPAFWKLRAAIERQDPT
jgi:hypothetical protein